MKKWLLACALVVLMIPFQAHASVVTISLPSGASNITGMAVNPANGHFYLTTLSNSFANTGYIDNLWEYDTSGALVSSTRVPIFSDYVYIGPIDFMDDGRIVSGVIVADSSPIRRYAFAYNADGSNPTLLYEGIPLSGDLSYASPGTLYTFTGFGNHQFGVNELALDGTLLSTFTLRNNRYTGGLAYDPVSGNLYVSYLYSGLFMEEYVKDLNGEYQFSQAYDLSGVMDRAIMAMDFYGGMFYAAYDNDSISVFSLEDLAKIDPPELYDYNPSGVPIPGPAILLASGLIGLAGVRKKIRG